jgi:hypothetical protein
MVRRSWPTRVRRGTADGPSVRGAHRAVRRRRRLAWPREDSKEPHGAAHGEGAPRSAGGLGRRGVDADAEVARRASVSDVAALRRSGRPRVGVTVFEPEKLQIV